MSLKSGAAARSNHNKLAHHAGILVLENMAVIHIRMVGIGEVRELSDDANCRTWIDEDGIFQAVFMRVWSRTGAVEHAELHIVDMKRMCQGRCIPDFPIFDAAERNSQVDAVYVH